MKILGFQKTTLLDFPEHIASIIFTAGCNLRCPYCQNSELILPGTAEEISEEEIFSHLESHIGRIEGLVITGGEPTLQPDLLDFCKKVKDLGLAVKLDSNGLNPGKLRELIEARVVDYVAVDVKMPTAAYDIMLPKEASPETVEKTVSAIRESIEILKNMPEDIDYETRTTIVDEFFDEDIIAALGAELAGIKRHFLQPYRDAETVLVHGLHAPSEEKLLAYRDILKRSIPEVKFRGVDL